MVHRKGEVHTSGKFLGFTVILPAVLPLRSNEREI